MMARHHSAGPGSSSFPMPRDAIRGKGTAYTTLLFRTLLAVPWSVRSRYQKADRRRSHNEVSKRFFKEGTQANWRSHTGNCLNLRALVVEA